MVSESATIQELRDSGLYNGVTGDLSGISGDRRYLANTQGAQTARREWRGAEFFTQMACRSHSQEMILTLLQNSALIGSYFPTRAESLGVRPHHGHLRRKSSVAFGPVPGSADAEALRPRGRSPAGPALQPPHRRGLRPLDLEEGCQMEGSS